jgi:hypothetical protein
MTDPHPISHACVSWTYVDSERAEEALLRIRRVLKEHEGWWTEHDEHLEREAFRRLGVKP